MSDRGTADEEDGDACNSDTKHTCRVKLHKRRSAYKRITSHPVIEKTQQVNISISSAKWKPGKNKSRTNLSRNTTLAHREPLESLTFKYIFMESGTDRRGLSSYRFRGAQSLQCCHLEWFSHSGPQAGSGAQCVDQTMTCCLEFLIPPNRCHSSCAERRPAGPAQGWWWRRLLADGGAEKQTTNEYL